MTMQAGGGIPRDWSRDGYGLKSLLPDLGDFPGLSRDERVGWVLCSVTVIQAAIIFASIQITSFYFFNNCSTNTSSILKFQVEIVFADIPSLFLPADPSMKEGTPVQAQSNNANGVPFPALPTHSSACEKLGILLDKHHL
jgi:hypothetical protein